MVTYRNAHDLIGLNTFAIKASCKLLAEFETPDDLHEIFSRPEVHGDKYQAGKYMVLSGGSNVLFTGDYDGTVLHPVSRGIEITAEDGDNVKVRAQAGESWDDFVAWSVERGLWGAENLSLIPGYVGAAPVQNIGAYGVEAADVIESVEMYDTGSGAMVTLAREHCGFGYRTSVFKGALRGKVVITAVNFVLSRRANPNTGYGDLRDLVESYGGPGLANIRRAVIEIREAKLPDTTKIGNAGSFFKNPVIPSGKARNLKELYPSMPMFQTDDEGQMKLAAGWLIEQCGWKGRRIGQVGVYDKQALVLVNYGGATGAEILELAEMIRRDVREKFAADLEIEVNII